jgi:hypothetical protein
MTRARRAVRAVAEQQDTFEADVIVDLREQGLRHAPGHKCCDNRRHQMSVPVTESDIDLIVDRFGPDLPFFDEDEVLQALHEQAHPDGTMFWKNCRERGCREAGDL